MASQRDTSFDRRGTVRRALALAVSYALASILLNKVAPVFGGTAGTIFWPGAGLSAGLMITRPRREWPWYVGAVAAVELALDLSYGYPAPSSGAWALANGLEPLVGALLLTRGGRPRVTLADRHDLGRFVVAAVLAAPALGALVGTGLPTVLSGQPLWPVLGRYFVGDAIGVLVVAPVFLVAGLGRTRRPAVRTMAGVLFLSLPVLVALGPWSFPAQLGLPFLVVPILAVIAMRAGPKAAVTAILFIAIVVESVTAAGHGPFSQSGAFDGLVVAQMFVAMAAITGLTVAALMSDLVSRQEVEATLRAQALHDNLTGLPNRRLLFDRLDSASRRLARSPGSIALLFVDLDRFKTVNDTFGHAAGDALLVATARRLESVLRDQDTVARLGGDEFLILAESPRSDEERRALAERARAAVARPFVWQGHNLSIAASVGIASTDTPLADVQELVAMADGAMYRAKHGEPLGALL